MASILRLYPEGVIRSFVFHIVQVKRMYLSLHHRQGGQRSRRIVQRVGKASSERERGERGRKVIQWERRGEMVQMESDNSCNRQRRVREEGSPETDWY